MSDSVTALVDRIAAGHQDPIRSVVDQIAEQYETQPDVGDYLHQAGASVAKGALTGTRDLFAAPETLQSAAASLVGPKTRAFAEGVAKLTPAHWIARGLGAAASTIEDDPEVQASRPGVAKWITTTGAGALGQAVPFIATAGAGAAAGLTARGATALTALTGMAANGVQGFEEAEKAGATPEQAFGSMLVNGGLGVLEAAEPALILARWDKRTGGMVSKTLLGAFGISGEKGMVRAAHVLAETATEAGTEGVQQLGGNTYAGLTYDERRQLTDGLGDAIGGGGFAGFLLSALTGHGPQMARTNTATSADIRTKAEAPIEGVNLTGTGKSYAAQTEPSGDSGTLAALSEANKQLVREVEAPDTPEAQYVQEFAAQTGRKVRFVEGNAGPLEVHGASEPGTIYVDRRAPLRAVAYHETVHQLGDAAEALAEDLRALDPQGSAAYERAYAENYQRATGRSLDAALASEEGVALRAEMNSGLLYEALQRPEKLRAMLESKPGAWTRVVDAVVRALQKVGVGLRTSKQRALDALRAEVAGQDASKALDSETAIRVALRISDAFATLQAPSTTIDAQPGTESVSTREPEKGPTEEAVRAPSPAPAPRIVVAEMPKGAQIGTDLTGEPVYSKVERGDIERPGAGIPQPKVSQPGIFDEVGGLFEQQAYGTEKTAKKEPTAADKARSRAREKGRLKAFIRAIGGIKSDKHEGRELHSVFKNKEAGTGSFGLGPIVHGPASTKGVHWEAAMREAVDAGFFPGRSYSDITYQEFFDALDNDIARPTDVSAEQQREPDYVPSDADEAEREAIYNESNLPKNKKVKGVPFSVAYHGSPYDFDEFSSDKIGTGEGAQAFGHGLYFTDKREIAEHYRNKLSERPQVLAGGKEVSPTENTPGALFSTDKNAASVVAARLASLAQARRQNGASEEVSSIVSDVRQAIERAKSHATSEKILTSLMDQAIALDRMEADGIEFKGRGKTYQVDLAPSEDEYLLWDKPLSEQSEKVKKAISSLNIDLSSDQRDPTTLIDSDKTTYHGLPRDGASLYYLMSEYYGPRQRSQRAEQASAALREAGIRGIKYLGDGRAQDSSGKFTYNYVIFDAKDVKVQAKFAVAVNNSFDLPDETRSRQFNRAVLDSFEALRLTPELDSAISRRPGLAYGRAERVQAQTIRGMIDVAKKVGKENADRFLYALHAPRRNEIIAERSGGKMGSESNPGSGMATSEARKIVSDAMAGPNREDFQRLRDMNRRLNVERLNALTEGGLLSAEQRAEWEKFGADYVPLRTVDDPVQRIGGGTLNVAGPESKRAEGRSTLADSPISSGVASFAQAVERGARNDVGQKLATFVEEHPSDQWGVYDSRDAIPEGWEVLSLKRGGAPVYIGTKNETIAAAFKQMDVQKATGVMRAAVAFRKLMHALIIKYNPPFAVSNALRDVGTASAKIAITDKAGTAARIVKNAPAAMLGSWKAIRNEGKGGEWGKWYREARDAGALVGWNELGSFQDVEDAIKRSKRSAILNSIENANRGVELGTRVALYEAMRAQGKTQEQAALIARDGTTDFARRGNYSSQLSALYLFANANLQGTASLWRAVAANPRRGSIVLGSLVAAGYALSLASRMYGDDWDDIPDYQKRRQGGVMIGDTLYGVPLPFGFDVFFYLGSRLEAQMNGRKQEDSIGIDMLEAAFQSFSPVQGADLLQTVTPTIARPLVEIAENKDFTGRSIRPQQSPFDRTPLPRSEQVYPSVDPTLRKATQGLNRLTGGDSVRSGAVDISAEDVEHVIKFLGGGVGSNITRIGTAANKWIQGEPVRASDVPVLRTFMSQVPESAVANLYYQNLTAIERETEARKKGEEILDPKALALATYARNVDRRVKNIRERMKASPDNRSSLQDAMRAAMSALNERMEK